MIAQFHQMAVLKETAKRQLVYADIYLAGYSGYVRLTAWIDGVKTIQPDVDYVIKWVADSTTEFQPPTIRVERKPDERT